jgi:hypothetical protein
MRPSRSRLAATTGTALTAVGIAGALVPPASASAAGGDSLASASAPSPAQLTLARRGDVPRYGRSLVLVARLTGAGSGLGGREIALHRDGTEAAKAKADSAGRATFKLKATGKAQYDARFAPASPEDVAAWQPAATPALQVGVRPLLRLKLSSVLKARKRVAAIGSKRLRISGTLAPYAGGSVTIRVSRRGRTVKRVARPLTRRGDRGRFRISFRPGGRGSYVVRASRAGDGELERGSDRIRLVVIRSSAGPGSRGPAVRALQRRLSALGYRTPVSGSFGASTSRAVLAFRKVNGMGRSSFAGRAVFSRLQRGGGAFKMRYPKAGKHVEFDWSRQVLVLARGRRAVRIVHASSGAAATPTVFGSYRFYLKTPGYNSKGMYYSSYFIGGYAIHGYASVPNFPASHGCIRIPIASAKSVYGWIRHGDRISVYR